MVLDDASGVRVVDENPMTLTPIPPSSRFWWLKRWSPRWDPGMRGQLREGG